MPKAGRKAQQRCCPARVSVPTRRVHIGVCVHGACPERMSSACCCPRLAAELLELSLTPARHPFFC